MKTMLLGKKQGAVFSTYFMGKENDVKTRFSHVFDNQVKSKGHVTFLAFVFFIILISISISISLSAYPTESDPIQLETLDAKSPNEEGILGVFIQPTKEQS